MNRTPASFPPLARRMALVSSDSRGVNVLATGFMTVLEAVDPRVVPERFDTDGSSGAVGSIGPSNCSPVTSAVTFLTLALRHIMVRATLTTRACQVSPTVPTTSMTRRVVTMRQGGSVSTNQNGAHSRMRTNSVVSAGRVVALVAVRCVLRKSVNSSNGSRSMLQRPVNSLSVSTISSSVFWCRA